MLYCKPVEDPAFKQDEYREVLADGTIGRFILIRLGQRFPTLLRCACNPVASQKWYHKRYHLRVSAETIYQQSIDFKQLVYLTIYSDPEHRVILIIDAPAPATRGLFYARSPPRTAPWLMAEHRMEDGDSLALAIKQRGPATQTLSLCRAHFPSSPVQARPVTSACGCVAAGGAGRAPGRRAPGPLRRKTTRRPSGGGCSEVEPRA